MAKIETVYRTRIDYDADVNTVNAIQDKAFDWEIGVKVETFCGNAACAPYITAEGETQAAVEAWAGKVERYIRGRKSAELFEAPTNTNGGDT